MILIVSTLPHRYYVAIANHLHDAFTPSRNMFLHGFEDETTALAADAIIDDDATAAIQLLWTYVFPLTLSHPSTHFNPQSHIQPSSRITNHNPFVHFVSPSRRCFE